jgi:hypothetical protein
VLGPLCAIASVYLHLILFFSWAFITVPNLEQSLRRRTSKEAPWLVDRPYTRGGAAVCGRGMESI